MWHKGWFLVLMSLLLWERPGHADLFETVRNNVNVTLGMQDYSGVSVRGSAHFSTGVAPAQTLLRGSATVGGSCGAFDFAASFREAFEQIPSVIAGYGEALAAQLPLLLFCYSFPGQCDLVKHYQAMMNVLIQARFGQCQSAQTAAMAAGLQLRGGEVAKCLADHQRAGATLNQAMRECHGTPTSLQLPDGSRGVEVRLIRDTMAAAGVSPELQNMANAVLGETTLRAGEPYRIDQVRPKDVLYGLYETHKQRYEDALTTAVEELAETGGVSRAHLQAIAIPGQTVPRPALDALALLRHDPVRYTHLRGQLATGAALTQLTWECHELEATLAAAAAGNAHLSPEERRRIEQHNQILRQELAQLMSKLDVRDKYVAPAVDALLREYTALQETAARVGLAAPAVQIQPSRYRHQLPMGYTK